jgi:anaerobic magnesium-protoporphyrin IX monomethyl ester cyclase
VRDADILHLYKKAGVARFLMGMESYDEATLLKIRKGGTTTKDREAIKLLRQHGILSMATWVVGFEEETDRDYWRGLRQLLSYDPDQIQLMYVTPHRWTPFFRWPPKRQVIQTDQKKWDYKHQVLKTRHVAPWRVLLWVKGIEIAMQLRPRSLWRLAAHPDRPIRDCIRWYYRVGRRFGFTRFAASSCATVAKSTVPHWPSSGALRRMQKRMRCKFRLNGNEKMLFFR